MSILSKRESSREWGARAAGCTEGYPGLRVSDRFSALLRPKLAAWLVQQVDPAASPLCSQLYRLMRSQFPYYGTKLADDSAATLAASRPASCTTIVGACRLDLTGEGLAL